MRVFFNSIVVQIILTAYVFWWGWRLLPKRKIIRIPFALFFATELIFYFIGFFGSRGLPTYIINNLGWAGTSWMIFIIYLTPFLLIYDLLKWLFNRKNRVNRFGSTLRKKGVRTCYYLFSIAFILGVMALGNYNFKHPQVEELTLEVDKPCPGIDQMKILVASDIHVGYLINKPILQKYVDLMMEQKADLILLIGDIIDYDIAPVIEQRMDEEFKKLQAPYGVFAVNGNHEYIDVDDEKEGKIKWLKNESGMTLLRDSVVCVNNAFYIVGREDDKCKTKNALHLLVDSINKKMPIIVMNHQPHNLNEEVENGADLAFYGHTHDGQIFPNNILLKGFYELVHGYKKKGNTHIYVSSGLGLAGPQYRIGTQSEIVILNVKFKNE